MSKTKKKIVPLMIGNIAVRQEGDPFVIDSGKLKGEKFISLVPVDKDNHSRWEYRCATKQAIHTINSNGDLI